MKLYYFPGACSLASDIALREAGIAFELVKLDMQTRRTDSGEDFAQVNPRGYVPALRLDDGTVLTENAAVLQYIADRNPAAALAPPNGTLQRYQLQGWLNFAGTEIHKSFSPLFNPNASEDVKQFCRANLGRRLDYLQGELSARPYLNGDSFSVVDGYLFTMLNWGDHTGVDIGKWPALIQYRQRIAARPKVVEALKAEGLMP